LFGKAEGHSREASRASGRAAELEAELAREIEAQRAAEREAREAAKAAERERRQVEKDLSGRVDSLEKSLPAARAAAAQAVAAAGTPARDLRDMARLFLRGLLQSGYELMAPEQVFAARDDAANQWHTLQSAANQLAALVWERLGQGPLYDRVDAVEVEAWAGYIGRVRQLAGQ
jgi:hypothetical protein